MALFLEEAVRRVAKTYMLKSGETTRKWYIIDAKSKPLGRVAAKAAVILRGKHKVNYTPHVDSGDFVVVINCADVLLTGNKSTQKYYYKHTGYIGNLKETRYDKLLKEKPEFVMEKAVKGMVSSNALGRSALSRLKVYSGSEHLHQAQKPEFLG